MVKGTTLSSLLSKIPFELHIPGYSFCGPNSALRDRLARGERGINPLDQACMRHDLAYEKYQDLENRHRADKQLVKFAQKRLLKKNSTFNDKLASLIVAGSIGLKRKIGMGLRRRRGKSKKGGILVPAILGGIGATASALSGASNIYKNWKAVQHQKKILEEIRKQNKNIETLVTGSGYYLRPYAKKKGKGVKRKVKGRRKR